MIEFRREDRVSIFQKNEIMKELKLVIVAFALIIMAMLQSNIEAAPTKADYSPLADSATIKVFPDTSTWVLTKILGTKSTKQHTGA